jgi:diguanylate cyclase (GGDEF)-like protein
MSSTFIICLFSSISTLLTGFALLVASALLKGEKIIRQLAWMIMAIGAALLFQTQNLDGRYGLSLVLPWIIYSMFPIWAWLRLRDELEKTTTVRVQLAYFAVVSSCMLIGFFLPSRAYQVMALAQLCIAVAYLACFHSAVLLTYLRRDFAVAQVALCAGLATVIRLPGPIFVLFHSGSDSFYQSQNHVSLHFASAFWLLTIAAFSVVMTILTRMHRTAELVGMADPLTQVLNRRGLEKHMAEIKSGKSAQNTEMRTGVIALDIDNFKPINDRYGHLEGDLVLIEFAKRLSYALRSQDVVARTGGEEFVVLISNADTVRLDEICERLRVSIEERGFQLSNGELVAVTASVGASQASSQDKSAISAAIRSADDALYRAKAEGRNRVVRA